MTYTNELEVKVDFSDVDPNLLEKSKNDEEKSVAALNSSKKDNLNSDSEEPNSELDDTKLIESQDSSQPNTTGKSSRFFRKKND